ncbi:galactose oxidase-like domain-containing protein, partial [Streptomyces tendae]
LLPDGRVMTFGSDSLFADKANTTPGEFQQQIDLYTPPYLFRDSRPKLTDTAPRTVKLGGKTTYRTAHASAITKMRLIRPGSFTHVTNVEQRSIALDLTRTKDGVTVTLPK